MRAFYPTKLLQLVALWVAVYLILHKKNFCATRKPEDLLSSQERGCHALLTAVVFEGHTNNDPVEVKNWDKIVEEEERLLGLLNETEVTNNVTEASGVKNATEAPLLEMNFTKKVEKRQAPKNTTEPKPETTTELQKTKESLQKTTKLQKINETATTTQKSLQKQKTTTEAPEEAEAVKTTMVMRGCIRVVERDVLTSGSSLDLYALRTPLAMLAIEVIFIVIHYVKVVTSYDLPDQLTIALTNMAHGLLWLVSALSLLIFRLGWVERWSSAFNPAYPEEYFSAEVICWLSVVFLLLETTLFPEVVYHDLVLEERGPGIYDEGEVQKGCGTFKKQFDTPLLANTD